MTPFKERALRETLKLINSWLGPEEGRQAGYMRYGSLSQPIDMYGRIMQVGDEVMFLYREPSTREFSFRTGVIKEIKDTHLRISHDPRWCHCEQENYHTYTWLYSFKNIVSFTANDR